MNPRARLGLAAGMPALLCCSCTYVEQRLADLHDCVLYRWHESALGVAADAKVGPLALTVGGWYAEWGVGKDTWWQSYGYVLTNHGYGVPITTLSPIAYGASLNRVLVTGSWGNGPTEPRAFDDADSWLLIDDVFDIDNGSPFALSTRQRIVDLFGVEVGVVPGITGLHVGFNVAELADALLGFVGIDIFGDDSHRRPPTLPYVPAERR